MAEKVARIGLKRDKDFIYYIKGGKVWRTRRKQPGAPKGRPEVASDAGVSQDNNYIYFLDSDGDVARAKRAIGGQKRKPAKKKGKPAPKKKAAPAKKAAKKPAKKKGRR